MGQKRSLKAALDNYKGKDYALERQKKLQKKARQVKAEGTRPARKDEGPQTSNRIGTVFSADDDDVGIGSNEDLDGEEDESIDDDVGGIDLSRVDETDSESGFDDEDGDDVPIKGVVINGHPLQDDVSVDEDANIDEVDDDDNEDDEDIPLSELSSMSSTAKEDILPHQRLTINNTAALQRSLKSIALPISQLAFSEHQSITTDTPVSITDVNDDLSRELAFYKQSLDAVKKARGLLKAEGIPFSRPIDFFAEMVKSDEHMGRIKDKLMDEASRKKAAVDARKQRDLRKFGKQVQVAKLQERDRLKKDTLDRIQLLKRKRKNAPDTGNEREVEEREDGLFNVGLKDDDDHRPSSSGRDGIARRGRRGGDRGGGMQRGHKVNRQQRDQRFGYGGKKRFSKSGDAISSGDLSRFNPSSSSSSRGGRRTSRGRGVKRQRLGKDRRAHKVG